MKALVTGGSGFLGAWVVGRLLTRGLQVRILDVSDDRRILREVLGARADAVEWFRGDVAVASQVESAMDGCMHVAHIAGVLTPTCRSNPVLGAQVNLLGTLHVFEAARRQGISRVVYVSSAGVYAANHGRYPEPFTHYGAFKLAAEGSARAYFVDAGISSVGFRPLVIYGPGREGGPSAGISLACRAAAHGEPYRIEFSGKTGFIYVDEVAQAIELAMFSDSQGAFVYPMKGEVADVKDVIKAIRQCVPGADVTCEGPSIWLTTKFDDSALYRDCQQLQRVHLSEGIARTFNHYRSFHGEPHESVEVAN
jgi:UDP-glucose 4-epimerase